MSTQVGSMPSVAEAPARVGEKTLTAISSRRGGTGSSASGLSRPAQQGVGGTGWAGLAGELYRGIRCRKPARYTGFQPELFTKPLGILFQKFPGLGIPIVR